VRTEIGWCGKFYYSRFLVLQEMVQSSLTLVCYCILQHDAQRIKLLVSVKSTDWELIQSCINCISPHARVLGSWVRTDSTDFDWTVSVIISVFVADLWNGAGHCIFVLFCLLLSLLLLLFSSPILSRRRLDVCHTSTHMWPSCEFRMQVWNVLHAARWKYSTQKIAKN